MKKIKNKDLCIWFAPIGGAMKFNKKSLNRFDGTLEYYKILHTLIRNESISKIYLLQFSDLSSLTISQRKEFDPRNVLVDIYNDVSLKRKDVVIRDNNKQHTSELYKNLNEHIKKLNIKFDFGIGIQAMGWGTTNIPNLCKKINDPEGTRAKSRYATYVYSTPIINFINENYEPNGVCHSTVNGKTLEWFLIALDPRYVKKPMRYRDIFNNPIEIISQFNDSINWQSHNSYQEAFDNSERGHLKDVNLVYTGIEKSNKIGDDIISPRNNRDIKMMLVGMQSTASQLVTKDKRMSMYDSYVLSHDNNCEIELYGKWNTYFSNKYPQIKGFLHHEVLDEKFKNTRYTLISPIGSNWITSKYVDMLYLGVLPFFAKDYDIQHCLVEKDHFIRVEDGIELKEKMEYLDNNPEERYKMIEELQNKLLKDVKSGLFLYKLFNDAFKRNNMNIELSMNKIEKIVKLNKLF